jgi:hypothetical protein
LLTGIKGALAATNYQMDPSNREESFSRLIHSQNDICWTHLLKGCFSHHWVHIQDSHIYHDDEICSMKFTGAIWLKKVLHHPWSHLYKAWKLRNTDLHGIDTADKEAKAKAKLRPAIAALYSTAASLPFLDRWLLDKDLTECLNQHSREQTAWISLIMLTIQIAKAKEAHLRKKSQRNIREFFLLPLHILFTVHMRYRLMSDDQSPN